MSTTPLDTFGIGRAIKEMQNGSCVSRVNWNGPGQYLELQVPDENSKMSLPYIYIRTVQGDLVPWLASQTDILAVDWYNADSQHKCGTEIVDGWPTDEAPLADSNKEALLPGNVAVVSGSDEASA